MGGEANKGRTMEAPFHWGPFEELCKMCLRTVLSEGQGAGAFISCPTSGGDSQESLLLTSWLCGLLWPQGNV